MSQSVRAALAAILLAALTAGCGATVVPQIHSDGDRLTVARKLHGAGQDAAVVEMLSAYVTTGTGSADIDQAVNLLGIAYLGTKEYASAQAQFERMARDFPESDSSAAAAYHLGAALFGQSRGPDFDQEYTLKAMSQWQDLVRDRGDDPYAGIARTRIAECRARLAHKLWRNGDVYLKTHLYEPAKIYFRSVLNEYADTPEYGNALIGNAVADARLGRKDTAIVVLESLVRDYEGRPLGLKAAETLAKVRTWPAEGDVKHRPHRSVESTLQAQPSSPGTTTPY